MKKLLLMLACAMVPTVALAQKPSRQDVARWERTARNVTVTRDDWGIAHVHGKTDADAVFGMEYAQAEDDFNRVEMNYLNALGRTAEANGESAIFQDLRMQLYFSADSLKALYRTSPEWLKKLMDAYADGLNYYLYTHPETKPKVIARFEPWMALSFSEGSIGWDIEDVSVRNLARFYESESPGALLDQPRGTLHMDPGGSNGIAIGPSNTENRRALLLINPHTSFFFRSELQMTSEEGLNVYGAVTWGQFFVYQGFNDRAGWMHTSTGAHLVDYYAETVTKKDGKYFYRYGNEERPVTSRNVTISYKTPTGISQKQFTVYATHHGPIVAKDGDKWIAVRMMQKPVDALIQSYSRTKAHNYSEFRKVFDLHANSSNNTIFADAEGNIAYFHSNFIPRRDESFDWSKPVDGSNPATEWGPLLTVDESPHLHNPKGGWLYNSNNWPFSAAGPYSPRVSDYPKYVDEVGENPRGIHAIRLLQDKKDFTMESLRAAAYDSYMPLFETLIPGATQQYDALPAGDARKAKLAEQVDMLRKWDMRWSETSVPTSLGVFWVDALNRHDAAMRPSLLLDALATATDTMVARYGTWKKPWGEINRFQRITDDIVHPFDDSKPSIPVGFANATLGSLASFAGPTPRGMRNIYGVRGNSFVAVVEFGDSVRAIAVTAGGESGDPKSKHFNDQAVRYSKGDLRPVYFYPSQLAGHTERVYRPGK